MANLIYTGILSLDGYNADKQGNFDWAVPDAAVHSFVNERMRALGTYLYGRRMYELMVGWETDPHIGDSSKESAEFAAIWKSAEKIVYSSTLEQVSTTKTQLVREFDPEGVRALKASAELDIAIGGPGLAAHAIRAGLVDEWELYLNPIFVGGGHPFLPDDIRVPLELVDEHRFDNGVVYLRYRTGSNSG